MDLNCYEQMPVEKTLELSRKNKIKTLYKLARNELFYTKYFCMYCGIIDSDKEWIQIHIKNLHDECGKAIKVFRCKMCVYTIIENEIMNHHVQYHD